MKIQVEQMRVEKKLLRGLAWQHEQPFRLQAFCRMEGTERLWTKMYVIKFHDVRDIVNEYLGDRATGEHPCYLKRLVVSR